MIFGINGRRRKLTTIEKFEKQNEKLLDRYVTYVNKHLYGVPLKKIMAFEIAKANSMKLQILELMSAGTKYKHLKDE